MVKINSNTQELTRQRVYNFYFENRILGKNYTVKHFLKEKIPESTVYSIIQRAEKDSVRLESLEVVESLKK